MRDGKGFDPHYADGCYVYRCEKGWCSFYSHCYVSEGMEKKKIRDFINFINQRLAEDKGLESLSAAEEIKLRHSIAMHGYRYHPEKAIFSNSIHEIPKGRAIYFAFGDLMNPNPDIKMVSTKANYFT